MWACLGRKRFLGIYSTSERDSELGGWLLGLRDVPRGSVDQILGEKTVDRGRFHICLIRDIM